MNRTVLIGLDGATFTILDPLMNDGVMPFLRSLADAGARADLRTIIPALTPPAWTSLMTGRRPGHHGIFDFFQRESADSQYLRFASASEVKCETIWSMASRQGLKVTALNFPLMFPPRPVNGYIVPGGWMPWKQLRLACHPSDLYDRLKALPGFNAREIAMDMSVEAKALEGCRDDEYEDWINFHIRHEEHWFEILRYLMRDDPSDLTAIMFDGVDKLQHLCWMYLDPAYATGLTTEAQQKIRALCLEYFRRLDGLLAHIVELAGPDANVVVASDHGFGPNVEIFNVNTWLEQQGYLAWNDEARGGGSGGLLGMSDLARYAYWLDWSRTTAYAATPSSNGIHIVRAGQRENAPGVPDDEYERFRAGLVAKLRTVADPVTGQPIISNIWTREEAFDGPCGALAPDLTLEMRDGGLVSILPSDTAVRPRDKVSGAHRPNGILFAAGPSIRAGLRVPELSILDVAPTLLYSLGLPIPADLEGRLPEEIIDPSVLNEHPVRRETATDPEPVAVGAAMVHPVYDAEAEATVLARLQALGYIE